MEIFRFISVTTAGDNPAIVDLSTLAFVVLFAILGAALLFFILKIIIDIRNDFYK